MIVLGLYECMKNDRMCCVCRYLPCRAGTMSERRSMSPIAMPPLQTSRTRTVHPSSVWARNRISSRWDSEFTRYDRLITAVKADSRWETFLCIPLRDIGWSDVFYGRYIDWLIDHIKNNQSFIQPEVHRNLILKRLEDGHQNDLSISRTTFKHGMAVWH